MSASSLKFLEFEITDRCHYSCGHCGKIPVISPQEPSQEEIQKVIERVRPESVSFTGGEPTLRWNTLTSLISYARENNCATQINTTGRDLTPTRLLELQDAGLRTLHVSVPSVTQELFEGIRGKRDTIMLAQILSALEFACKNTSLKVIVETLLLKRNLHEIPLVYQLVSSWGASGFEIQNTIPTRSSIWKLVPNDAEILETLNQLSRQTTEKTKIILCCLHLTPCSEIATIAAPPNWELYKCVCGREGAYITVTGDILGCSFFHKPIGNAFREDILEVWQRAPLFEQIRKDIPSACATCTLFEKCRNPCQAVIFQTYGRFNQHSHAIYQHNASSP